MDIPHLFIHLSVGGHLECFYLLTLMNNAAINLHFIFNVEIPRNGIAWKYGNCVCLRTCETI